MTTTFASKDSPWWSSMTRAHWFVFAIASLAWLFDCLDQQLFNLARDGAMDTLVADKARLSEFGSYTTSFFLVGWAVGGLVFGALGDRYGRARMLAVCVLLYSLCTGLSSFASSYEGFCFYRVLTGLGVGGVFGLAVALVADSLDDRCRAPALGLLQSLSTVGNVAAGLIGIGVGLLGARGLLPFALREWQVMFLVGAIPALLCVFVIGRLKEPAKWEAARAEGLSKGIKPGSYLRLLRHPRWSRNAWFGLVLCSAGIVGLWGIGNFHPTIVRSIVASHLAGEHLAPEVLASAKAHWSSVALMLHNSGGFFGMMVLSRVAHVRGRRFALGLAILLSFASTVLVFKGLREVGQIWWMLPLMGFGQLSVFALYAIYLPELFPTSLRSTGASFCYNLGRLVAASAPFTIGRVTRSLGGDLEAFRTAGLYVSLVLLLGLAVLPFLPETKGQPLPED